MDEVELRQLIDVAYEDLGERDRQVIDRNAARLVKELKKIQEQRGATAKLRMSERQARELLYRLGRFLNGG